MIQRHQLACVFSLTIGSLLSAQIPTSHPQEATQGVALVAPFGVLFGSEAEARTQILVPRHELPAVPAQLVGIEVRAPFGAPMVYTSLRIDVAETSSTQLQATFANNLPTPPTTALNAAGYVLPFVSGTWTRIAFTTAHTYGGSAGLVLDIRKVVNLGSSLALQGTFTPALPLRLDRPFMQVASGTLGSGAANATVANAAGEPIAVRLLWNNTPALRNRSDGTTATGASYALGGQVDLTVQAAPNSPWWLAIAPSFLATPVAVAGFVGEYRLDNALLIGGSVLDAQGLGSVTIPLPTSPAFVGLFYAYQAVVLDPANGALVFSNGTDHFINP
jgi:hypothetical protein